jgi:hypothetical protein
MGVYLILRKRDTLGGRLAGLITIMIGVWALGMAGFALLDFLLNYIESSLWPLVGIGFLIAWLGLWHYATRLYFRYELRRIKTTIS